MSKQRFGKMREMLIRGVCALLCIAMLISLLPMTVFADDIDKPKSDNGSSLNVSNDNMYALVVSTGAAPGESVLYFTVRYTGEDGITRSEFVFPNHGALSDSYQELNQTSTPQEKLDYYKNAFGYEPIISFGEESGLRQNSVDTYFFNSCSKIKEILSVDMFMRHGGEEDTRYEWTCNDIRVYKVDTLFGAEMTGYYSSSYFADFSGELIAKFLAPQWNSGDFYLDMSDKLFRIGMTQKEKYDLQTDFSDGKIDTKYNASATAKKLVFRFDFTDEYGAGIEALANLYSDNKAPLDQMGLAEALNAIITYDDIYGASRKITLPVILSSAGWALESNNSIYDNPVIGIAQQGDTILFEALLPDFAELTGYSLFFGANAAEKAGLRTVGDNIRRSQRIQAINTEEIYYSGFSIFEAETAKAYASTEDAVLMMTTQGNPMYYYKSANGSGQKMSNDQQKNVFGDMKVPPPSENGAVTLLSTDTGGYKYIFEIGTDEPADAATADEIIVRISYYSTDGNLKRTGLILARDAVKNFYGYWPAKDDKEIAYLSGVCSGGKMYFTISDADIDYFSSIELTLATKENAKNIMTGEAEIAESSGKVDDWQMSGIKIYKVSKISRRQAVWLENDLETETYATDRMITREFEKNRIYQSFDERLLLTETSPTKEIHFSETGETSIEDVDVDWDTINSSMSYNETLQDIGFDKARFSYTVNVTVQSNSSTNDDMGDCGSVNKFYFQLIFESGVSAYVQANQQLTGDGFRAGRTESFKIKTNRDYGDLKAIRIIPDDTVDEDNIYDKLNVKEINVIQDSSSGLSYTWNFYPVGWIGIDYKDSGAQSTIVGQKLRGEFEISRNYLVSSTGYSLNLLFAMTTGAYDENDPQYAGSLEAIIYYRDNNNISCSVTVDVADAMAAYAERNVPYAPENNPGISGKKLIDQDYMLKENHTDRFIVSLTNVRELISMTLLVGGTVNTTWNLEDVSVYLIDKDGPLIINSCNEYQREAELTCICSSIKESGYQLKSVYTPANNTTTVEEYPVIFSDFIIDVDMSDFETKIERMPTGDDDACNVILYPKAGTNLKNLNKVSLALKYQSREFDKPFQVSLNQMNYSDALGTIYYRGLSTKSMTKLNELIVKSDKDLFLDHAIVQQVRSNVVVRTYYVPFDSELNAHISSVSGMPYRSDQLVEKQVISLQMSEDTADTVLVENLTDVAVGFTYSTTTDIDSVIYDSSYVFLTDQDVRKLYAGQHIDVEFEESCVKDIKYISLVATDVINATVNCATATIYQTNGAGEKEAVKSFSFSKPIKLTRNKQNMIVDDPSRANVANLTFTVNFDSKKMTSKMQKDRISAVIGYADYMGDSEVFKINDLETFRTSSEKSKSESITVNVMIPGMISLEYIKLEPHSDDPALSAGIPVTKVEAEWIVNGASMSVPAREVNQMIEEGEGYTINLANVDVICDITVLKADDSVKLSRSISSRDFDLSLADTEHISFEPRVTNSKAGFDVKIEIVSGNCTYDMDQESGGYVFTPKKPASDDGTSGKTEAAKDTVYCITISSKEMPNVKVTINLTYKVS